MVIWIFCTTEVMIVWHHAVGEVDVFPGRLKGSDVNQHVCFSSSVWIYIAQSTLCLYFW